MVEMVEVAPNDNNRKDREQQLRGGSEMNICEQLMCIAAVMDSALSVAARGVIVVVDRFARRLSS